MISSDYSNPPDSPEEHNFEQLVQDAIAAVKKGNRSLAVDLFEKAAMINDADIRIWIWMSATTDDLEERRKYLEHAVQLDPSNATAQRGLQLVAAKLEQARFKPEEELQPPQAAQQATNASSKTYVCPNCGATISYDIQDTVLVCQFCGFKRKVDERLVKESKDQQVGEVAQTERAPRWVEGQTCVACEQCGAVIALPAGQTAESCPYCASNRFIAPSSPVEMVDPQAIGFFRLEPKDVGNEIKTWLSKGWLAPDKLAEEHAGMQLHPAYYPFWLFDGTLEIPWYCDINVGTSKLAQWEAQSGSQSENFKDVLMPGLRRLSPSDLAGLGPFMMDELVEFSPDHLAGGMALAYDIPMEDASLKAREMVFKKVKDSIAGQVMPGQAKRNFSTGDGKWSDLTYKLALLPIYTGNYAFQGKRYRLLVNGQTGRVSGKKPVDNIKVAMVVIASLILLVVLVFVLLFLVNLLGG